MQKTLLVAGLTLLLSTIGYIQNQQPVDQTSKMFEEFKSKHQKSYQYAEETYRRAIFEQNYAKILAHNADPTQTYTAGVNQFTDLTQDEFVSIYLTYTPPEGWQPSYDEVEQEGVEPNDSVDWSSYVHVKNQGNCGSCWSFSATGAVEGFHRVTKGVDQLLSEQQLVDCEITYSKGCNGGYPDKALLYIQKNKSVVSSSYPYTAKQGTCKSIAGTVTIGGVQNIARTGLQAAIKQYPISVCVDATNWNLYNTGVFSNCSKNINHAVVAVGYDASGNWKIKNSWATSWGESGFIRLAAGDTCGVTQIAVRAI